MVETKEKYILRAGTVFQMYLSRLWRIPSIHLGPRELKIVPAVFLLKTWSRQGVFEEGANPVLYNNGCVTQPSKEQ